MTDFVHAHDVRVHQPGDGARLAQEPLLFLGVEPTRMRNLDGDRPIELRVVSFPNRAATADA